MTNPYVEIKGIPKHGVKYPTKNGIAVITTYYTRKVQGQDVYAAKINGKDVYITTAERSNLVAMVQAKKADYEARFKERYPGIYMLVDAINAEADYHHNFDRMMDDEDNDGVNPPTHPKISVAKARKQYPIAAAYLDILRYADADPSSQVGYDRRCTGDEAIETGAGVIAERDKMLAKLADMPVEDRS